MDFVGQRVTPLLHLIQGVRDGELARHLCGIQPGFQLLYFGVLGESSRLPCAGNLGLRKLHGIALVLLGQFKALVQLLVDRAVAHLLQDIGVPRLVDFECFLAVGSADDFVCSRASLCIGPSCN